MGGGKTKPDFFEWYAELYKDRWTALRDALEKDPGHIALTHGLKKSYYLDEASVISARALAVSPGDHVLDMCAAPGGKTLVLATALEGSGVLIANDRSSTRRARLHRVLDEYLDDNLRPTVTVTGHDATRWGLYEQEVYDKILLDAPCSSERHVMNSPTHLTKWSPARTRHLAAQAYAMLAAAFLAVKIDGLILYSTCSLSPLENDGVVGRLLRKKSVSVDLPPVDIGEKTDFGVQIFPDTSDGKGPMYICRIRRNS
ncbi:MAG: RsmB/NOP family class I SAM-dependent RNA methyltransferase [Spirochaetales bacterium]|jgi:5-methylcytosine rRNA methyltransferase NSUN4|nr:RsmB/NOP family class I SAM-dependent RNA methyltransferase [Spirochaetales bacterium]